MAPFVKILGIMQDAGLPHIGCRCRRCLAAAAGGPQHLAAAVAVVDRRRAPAGVWLVDATPDINEQLALLADDLGPDPRRPDRLRQPDAIFLTHAHMGHVSGLPQLGPEGMHVQALPLYAAPPLLAHLRRMPLWQPLLNGLRLEPLEATRPVALAPELTLTPIPVPHRDETGSGTYGLRIQGPRRTLLYVPDIDSWAQWEDAESALVGVDVAVVDGAFYRRDELPGRGPVAHPLVEDTLTFWAGRGVDVWLTHVNHTNSVLDEGSAARRAVEAAGVRLAAEGDCLVLS